MSSTLKKGAKGKPKESASSMGSGSNLNSKTNIKVSNHPDRGFPITALPLRRARTPLFPHLDRLGPLFAAVSVAQQPAMVSAFAHVDCTRNRRRALRAQAESGMRLASPGSTTHHRCGMHPEPLRDEAAPIV